MDSTLFETERPSIPQATETRPLFLKLMEGLVGPQAPHLSAQELRLKKEQYQNRDAREISQWRKFIESFTIPYRIGSESPPKNAGKFEAVMHAGKVLLDLTKYAFTGEKPHSTSTSSST